MASEEETLRDEALQIAKRVQRHLSGYVGTISLGQHDALALADRVVKLEELRQAATKRGT